MYKPDPQTMEKPVQEITVFWKWLLSMASGIILLPWGQFAFALSCLYTIHLIIGWWLDRFGKKNRRNRH